jgi:hypothetical protein
MKIVRVETPIAAGAFAKSRRWKRIETELWREIRAVDWPPGAGTFTIFPEAKANGVKPIKNGLIARLTKKGGSRKNRSQSPLSQSQATSTPCYIRRADP